MQIKIFRDEKETCRMTYENLGGTCGYFKEPLKSILQEHKSKILMTTVLTDYNNLIEELKKKKGDKYNIEKFSKNDTLYKLLRLAGIRYRDIYYMPTNPTLLLLRAMLLDLKDHYEKENTSYTNKLDNFAYYASIHILKTIVANSLRVDFINNTGEDLDLIIHPNELPTFRYMIEEYGHKLDIKPIDEERRIKFTRTKNDLRIKTLFQISELYEELSKEKIIGIESLIASINTREYIEIIKKIIELERGIQYDTKIFMEETNRITNFYIQGYIEIINHQGIIHLDDRYCKS